MTTPPTELAITTSTTSIALEPLPIGPVDSEVAPRPGADGGSIMMTLAGAASEDRGTTLPIPVSKKTVVCV
jgi:hypothetical protein